MSYGIYSANGHLVARAYATDQELHRLELIGLDGSVLLGGGGLGGGMLLPGPRVSTVPQLRVVLELIGWTMAPEQER